MKYIITECLDGGWMLQQQDNQIIWPTIIKETKREVIARLMQLMDVGPVNPKHSTEALKRSDRDRLVIAVEALQSLARALAQSNEEWLKATLKMTLEAIGPLDAQSSVHSSVQKNEVSQDTDNEALKADRDSLREELARANELSEQRLVEATEYMFQVSHLNDELRLATESLFAAASDLDWCAVKLSYIGTGDSFTHANSCFEKALSSLGLSQSQYADVYEASENEESVFDAIVAQAIAPASPKGDSEEEPS